jgi:hypothetical protein
MDRDRFNDDYDPDPDYDRPTLADELVGQPYPLEPEKEQTVSSYDIAHGNDPTEAARRQMVESGQPYEDARQAMVNDEATWTTEELSRDFEVVGFMAPFVVVKRKSDGKKGTLEFTHNPRVYFGWSED